MSDFIDELEASVAPHRQKLLGCSFFRQLMDGTLTKKQYEAFLIQVYHYTKHTPRLLTAAASRLPPGYEQLFDRLMENAHEELGHHLWALEDVRALGGDAEKAAVSLANASTEALTAYSYYVINYVSPIGLLGTNYALETLGGAGAVSIANRLKEVLKIGDDAVTFIHGHGETDVGHVEHLKRVTREFARTADDKQLIIRTAQVVYRLYLNMMNEVQDL